MLAAPAVPRVVFMHFICPLCQSPFREQGRGVFCLSGHHFDRAKEGYLNLLPVHHKNSRNPGDARSQLLARRKFLDAGFFAPLLPVLASLVPKEARTLLDIGCGEGYFSHGLAAALPDNLQVYAIDIAKEGIRLAARRYPENYAVASAFALPLASASMDVVTRIYAPSHTDELKRVLSPQGRLLVVTPAEQHLLRLRKHIYSSIRPHPEPGMAGFDCLQQQRLGFSLQVPPGELTAALLEMTPYAWRLSESVRQQLIASGLEDDADFHVAVYKTSDS